MQPKSRFTLFVQHPRPKRLGGGMLAVDRAGVLLASMQRTRLDSASSDGLMLSGMEQSGMDRAGRELFGFQEWWLSFVATDK